MKGTRKYERVIWEKGLYFLNFANATLSLGAWNRPDILQIHIIQSFSQLRII